MRKYAWAVVKPIKFCFPRPIQQGDATVCARDSSYQVDQGAGRQIDEETFQEMKQLNIWQIPYDKFLKLILPSFAAVEDPEDMDAIAARPHLIVINEFDLYYGVASASKDPGDCIIWTEGEPKDLLSPTQHQCSSSASFILTSTSLHLPITQIAYGHRKCFAA